MPPTRGKGLGSRGNMQPRKSKEDLVLESLTRGATRKLARRAGVKRIKGNILNGNKNYKGMLHAYQKFLEEHINNACIVMDSAKRRTVTKGDILYSLKSSSTTGNVMYYAAQRPKPLSLAQRESFKKRKKERDDAKKKGNAMDLGE